MKIGYARVSRDAQELARQSDRIRAAEILMDRGWGRPAQETWIGGIPGSPLSLAPAAPQLNLTSLSESEREALVSLLRKATPDQIGE